MVKNRKKVLKTSFRSAAHTTDSTWRGWIAKRAATDALLQRDPVILRSSKKRKAVLMAWRVTLVKWCPAGFNP